MNLDQLHQQYGRLLIEAEILQARIKQTKAQIAEAMNAQPAATCSDGTTSVPEPADVAPRKQDAET